MFVMGVMVRMHGVSRLCTPPRAHQAGGVFALRGGGRYNGESFDIAACLFARRSKFIFLVMRTYFKELCFTVSVREKFLYY